MLASQPDQRPPEKMTVMTSLCDQDYDDDDDDDDDSDSDAVY